MGIDIDLWRARIGLFNGGRGKKQPKTQGKDLDQILDLLDFYLQEKYQRTTKQTDLSVCPKARTESQTCEMKSQPEPEKASETCGKGSQPGPTSLQDDKDMKALYFSNLLVVLVMFCFCSCCVKVESSPSDNSDDVRGSYNLNWTAIAYSGVIIVVVVFLLLLLVMAGDVELNPGPQENNKQSQQTTDVKVPSISLDDLVKEFHLQEKFLATEVAQEHLLKVSRSLDCWKLFARTAGFSEPEIVAIERDGHNEDDRRYKTLDKWHMKNAFLATFKLLIETLLDMERANIAQEVCRMQDSIALDKTVGDVPVANTSAAEVTEVTLQKKDTANKVLEQCDTGEPPVLSLKRTLSNLSASGMSETKMKEVEQKLWLESSELSCKYHTMCSALYKSLKRNDDAKDDLTACLFSMDTLLPVSRTSNQPAFEDQKMKLFEAKNLREVWFIISFYHSYFNYYLIEHIADMLGTYDDKENVSSYKQAFADYAKRRVYECPKEFGYENQDDCTLIVKLDKTHDKCTLEQLKLFEKKLCDILELSSNGALRLCTVEKGCYELTFQAPSFVQETVFPLSTQQEAALKALGVVWLLCGDYEYSSQHNIDADNSSGDEDDHPDDASQSITLFERIDQVLQRPKKSPGSTSDSGLGKSNDTHTETKSLISDFSEDTHSVELQFHESQKEQTSFVSTQLNVAAYNGNLTVVKSCIDVFHHDPSQLNNQGYMTLHIAANGGQLEIVKFLVEEKNMPAATETANGRTALHIAAFNGHLPLVQYFVEVHGVDPMLQDKQLYSPLHDACRNGNTDVVRYIITQAQQHETIEKIISDSTRLGSTILHFAAASGSKSLLQLFISEFLLSPNTPGQLGAMPLHVAAQEGHLNVVEYLASLANCNMFCVIQKHEQNALHFAASRGHIAIVKILTTKIKFDPTVTDSSGRTPLHLAALNGHLEVIRFLVEDCKCDMLCLTKKRYTPLHIAAMEGHTNVVTYFTLKRKVDPLCRNINSITPLHLAVKAGKPKVVSLYIKNLKVNLLLGRLGEKLIFKAVWLGNLAIVRELVSTQQWTKTKTGFRQNQLLHNAVALGHLEVLKYFIIEKSWEFIPMIFDNQSSLPHIAALKGHLEIVKFFIADRKYNPDSTDHVRATPLHRACQGGHLNIVHYLLDNCKADKGSLSFRDLTLLHFAAVTGHCHIVQILTQTYGVDPLCSDIDGNTPLHYAAGQGNLDLVKFFILRSHVSANVANRDGVTPINYACSSRRTDVVNFLLEQPECMETKSFSGPRPLLIAIESGHLDIVKLIITNTVVDQMWRDDNGNSLLHYAASNGHLEIVKYLSSKLSIDLNVENCIKWTPLITACLKGHENVVRYLLLDCKCPMTTDSDGLTLLHHAAIQGQLNIVKLLTIRMHLDHNCRDNKGWTPLHYAAKYAHLKVAKFLVKQLKCDPNVQDDNGVTPLFCVAIGHEHFIDEHKTRQSNNQSQGLKAMSFFKYFVEELNSDPVKPTSCGTTPFHIAAGRGELNIVNYLIKQLKVDVNTCDKQGATPLHFACQKGQKKVIDYLLSDDRCNKNPRDLLGQTPLHYASIEGNLDIIKFLIREKNWDPMCRDAEGSTPLHFSAQDGHLDIVKFFVKDLDCDPSLSNFIGVTPLHYAAVHGRLAIVKFLTLEKKCDPMCRERYNNTPVIYAVRYQHFDIVNFFITKLKVDPLTLGTRKQTLLHLAASVGNMKIWNFLVSRLRKQMCVINKVCDENGLTPFHVASGNGNIDIVKQLLIDCSQLPLDNDMRTPLHYAARYNHLDIVKQIALEKRFDPMCKDCHGNTPLHFAAINDHLDIVNFYVDVLNFSLFTLNKYGVTPYFLLNDLTVSEYPISIGQHNLHLAAEKGKKIIIQRELDKGVNPNILDNLKRTPLHYTTMGGKLKAAEALLKVGADPLAEDVFRNLPLHYAAALGHHEVVKLLIKNGGHRDTKGMLYLTPFKMAMIGEHHHIGELLFKSIITLK